MHSVITHSRAKPKASPEMLDSMFQLRCRVFRDRMKWDIECEDDRDIDYFDQLYPIYALYSPTRQTTEGCWRILPTTGPNMLADIFPGLVETGPIPQNEDVWEISRFAVDTLNSTYDSLASLHRATSDLLISLVEFAQQNKIRQYVACSDVRFERILRRSGLTVKRLGKVQRIGTTPAVAGYIDINAEQLDQLYVVAEKLDATERMAA